MPSGYIIDAQALIAKLDAAVRQLHDATTSLKEISPPRLTGDAHFIFDDVCELIELLGKVDDFKVSDPSKVSTAMLALACIEARGTRVMQAAE